ncbi:MAG: hypothetical protein JF614_31205 [Acidobacteria bacterium]|nr:hypothetical protein [Acidobacteriota bacterium]
MNSTVTSRAGLLPELVSVWVYFFYQQREEDRVLDVVVRKVQTIQKEPGSLSAVFMERYTEILDRGIAPTSEAELEEASQIGGRREIVREELESERSDIQKLKREIDEAGGILDRSRKALEFDPGLLRETVDAALVLAGADPLKPLAGDRGNAPAAYLLPDLPESWQGTLDTLRPPRGKEEPFWDWRKRPLLPVVFEAMDRLDGSRVHLHLQHPFVQRLLSRFLAQGYGAHDLHASAPKDFAALWPHVEAEAEALAHEAERKLAERGATESEALRGILRNQRSAIQKAIGKLPQLTLAFSPTAPKAREQIRQIEQDRDYMEGRLIDIDREIETEPAAIQDLYRVVLTRREPVGMVYLWPAVRG